MCFLVLLVSVLAALSSRKRLSEAGARILEDSYTGTVVNTQNIGNVAENSNVLYTFELAPSANITLEATLWLDYYYSGQNEVYSARYTIEAKQVDEYGRIYLTNLVGKNKGIIQVSSTEYRYNGTTSDNYIMLNNELYRMLGVVNGNILAVNVLPYSETNATAFFNNIADKSLLDTTAGATNAAIDQYNTNWFCWSR